MKYDDLLEETRLDTREGGGSLAPVPLDRWGPFERLQRVGRGSFGEVYRAFDPTLQRYVALKLLVPRGDDWESETGELLREARALARVRHPNVVAVHGVDRHEGRVGFWSDFVQGRTFSELLQSHGPLGPREAALVGIDVCKAAAAVHAAGFLHRDIKAGNVMREEGGRILLMDFGLTHKSGNDDSPRGTPAYMAPELLLGQPATVASDVYAIGVLLFFLTTGQHPVAGANLAQLVHAHATGARRTLLDVRPDLPEPLARVVDRAADPDPSQRFASVGQMIGGLSDAIGMDRSATEPRRGKRWPLAWTAPVAVVAVALGLVFQPQIRKMITTSPAEQAPPAQQEEYGRAHDLLNHYYRPRALDTAIAGLQRIVAEDARYAPAYADLGRANFLQFVQLRDATYVDAARQASLRAVQLSPDLASAHVTLGMLYARTGQKDIAAHELDEALRLDRFNAAAYGAQADLYERQGRTELVEPTLKKAVSLAPDDWNLVQQLGEYLSRQEPVDAGRRAVPPCRRADAGQPASAQQSWARVSRTGETR